ncbi:DsbA family protein [Roseibium algae]|uniref:DsbA family protein n=1 Tax=Roseibium algae TaxID=3123038 RepID=A0ABU8TGK0_9HYPH
MAHATHLTYLTDPMCGWCYGAAPVVEQLAAHDGITLKVQPTGLFAGAGARAQDAGFASFAWPHDQRIAQMSGQTFSEDYRTKVLGNHSRMLDSGPAGLAMTAVAMSTPEQELAALAAIQRARYVEGRDITDKTVLADILSSLGLKAAHDHLLSGDTALTSTYQKRIADGQAAMRRFGIGGVPGILVGEGKNQRPVQTDGLFSGVKAMLTALKAA